MEVIKIEPLTKEESMAMKNPLFKNGTYQFEVIKAEKKFSKQGNLMIAVTLRCIDFINGREKSTLVNDYLLTTGEMRYKLRHFCDTIGMIAEYEKGELVPEHMIRKNGIAELIIQEDKSGHYDPKNSVKDYVIDKVLDKNNEVKKEMPNDDLPF